MNAVEDLIGKSLKSVSSVGFSDQFWSSLGAVVQVDLASWGYAIVELPEPLRNTVWPVVISGETEAVGAYPGDGDEPIAISGIGRLSIAEARRLGATLLAAAKAVEDSR